MKMKPKMPYIPKSIFEVNKSGVGAEEVKSQSVGIKIIGLVIIVAVCVVSFVLIVQSASEWSNITIIKSI